MRRAGGTLSDTGLLMLASIANGVFSYGFAWLGLRTYGAEGFAPIALIWSVWALAVASTTFPIQHWVNWQGEIHGDLGTVRATVPALVVYVGAAAVGSSALLWLTAPLLRDPLSWVLLAGVLVAASGVLGWGRGVLAARHEYRSVALVIAGENAARLAAGIAVVAMSGGILAFGWALAMGPLVLLPFWRKLRMPPPSKRERLLAHLGGLSAAVVVAQAFVQLASLAAEWLGSEPVLVSAVFATFAIFRAPVLVGLAAVTRITTPLTAMVVARDHARLAGLLKGAVLAIVGGAPIAFLASWGLGPAIVEGVFGEGSALDALSCGLIGAGMWMAVVGLGLLVLHVAAGTTVAAMAIWGGAAVIAVVVAVLGGEPGRALALAFVVGEGVAVMGSLVAHRRWLASR